MMRMLFIALTLTGLVLVGCGQNQPSPPAQPKPEAKPPAEASAPQPTAPVPTASPAVQPTPAPQPPPAPPETTKPVEAAKPAAAPIAAPAVPAAPPAPAKPAVKIPNVPDTLILPASQGQITLPHLAHAKLFPCATCHGDGTPGKIGLTKDTAHALCRDCHKAKGAGPTACGACHKK